jgi:hypothetical protein
VILYGPDKDEYASDKAPSDKRKRGAFTNDEIMDFTHMTEAVKDVTKAIKDNKPTDMHPWLYQEDMEVAGFTEDALLASLGHLVDHKAQGTLFVGMAASHGILTIWPSTTITCRPVLALGTWGWRCMHDVDDDNDVHFGCRWHVYFDEVDILTPHVASRITSIRDLRWRRF